VKILCKRCRKKKPPSSFGKKPKGKFQAYCKPCQVDYRKEHYAENSERYKAAAKRRRRRIFDAVDDLKRVPCADCRRKYPPYVMDFDHRDGEEKGENISLMRQQGVGMKRILEEAAKCDVVCSNCHRIRTHERRTRG